MILLDIRGFMQAFLGFKGGAELGVLTGATPGRFDKKEDCTCL